MSWSKKFSFTCLGYWLCVYSWIRSTSCAKLCFFADSSWTRDPKTSPPVSPNPQASGRLQDKWKLLPMVGWLHHGPEINQHVASREGKTLVLPQGLAHELLWMLWYFEFVAFLPVSWCGNWVSLTVNSFLGECFGWFPLACFSSAGSKAGVFCSGFFPLPASFSKFITGWEPESCCCLVMGSWRWKSHCMWEVSRMALEWLAGRDCFKQWLLFAKIFGSPCC